MAKIGSNNTEISTGPLPVPSNNPFKPATLRQSHIRLMLTGVAGAGKTYTALSLAEELAEGGRIAVIDTEQGSAALYSKRFSFDHAPVTKYTPRYYIQLLQAAAANGYKVCIIDSLTPSWTGKGGILAIADGNIRGWKDATPEYDALVEALTSYRSRMHVIATVRGKIKHEVSNNPVTGKLEVQKLGVGPIHRDQLEYEFDAVGYIDTDHVLSFSGAGKSRLDALADRTFTPAETKHAASIILDALSSAEQEEPIEDTE